MRLFVAWTVWLRVRGLAPGVGSLHPGRTTSDYPSPNDPVSAAAVLVGWAFASALIASAFGWLVSATEAPSTLWPAIFIASAFGSVVYALRRVHADDRRHAVTEG
jgi:apolipoprotein N-acyltransferase